MKKLLFLFAMLVVCPVFVSAQEEQEEDPNKMIREVISIEVEKPKYVAPPVVETPGKKGKKKHVEEPVVEEMPADTGSNMMPAPVAEIAKRASNWTSVKNKKFQKTNVSNSGSTISCIAVFPYKPKELNPVNDVEGEISMEVLVECKEGKYRYTVHKISHKSKKGVSSGGDVFNDVPECGSMNLNSITWKQIKSAALADANIVAQELKAKMQEPANQPKKSEW
jgi:hypothetical protein